jgi:hypothetical protein
LEKRWQVRSEHSLCSSAEDVTEEHLQTEINEHDELEEDVLDEDMCSADLDIAMEDVEVEAEIGLQEILAQFRLGNATNAFTLAKFQPYVSMTLDELLMKQEQDRARCPWTIFLHKEAS